MIEIFNIDDFRVAPFFKFRDRVLHDQNLVVCESEKLFLKFIHNNGKILKTLSTKEFAEKHQLNSSNNFFARKELLEQIAGFKLEYDILFLIDRPTDSTIDQLDHKIILLNGLTSPENVGSIVRSAAGFNINSLIVDEKSCSPYLRRCIRVSMGNIFSMKVFHAKNIRLDLVQLKARGYKIISTANLENSIALNTFHFPDKYILIIGSEGHGIDHDILALSDVVLKININENVAHLNAANAASIFLYEMSRGQ